MAVQETNLLKEVLEVGVVVAVVAVGLSIIAYVRRSMREEPDTQGSLLEEFQAAYDAGEIDLEEYNRVRDSVLKRGGVVPNPIPKKAPEPELPAPPDSP